MTWRSGIAPATVAIRIAVTVSISISIPVPVTVPVSVSIAIPVPVAISIPIRGVCRRRCRSGRRSDGRGIQSRLRKQVRQWKTLAQRLGADY